MSRRAFFIRNLEAWAYLEVFLVTAVLAILGIRVFLEVVKYPRIGGAHLHIAHMLWGGLLMLAAIIIFMNFLSRTAYRVASALGGLGFGTFIDEVGKFVTADNNYFFAPAVALIYSTFVVTILAIHAIRTRWEYSDREFLVNALRQLEEFALHGLDEEDRERVLLYLAASDPEHPVVSAIRDLVTRAALIPPSRPGPFARAKHALRSFYRRAVRLPGFPIVIVSFFAAQLAVGLGYALTLVFFLGGWERLMRIRLIDHLAERLAGLTFVDAAQLASFALASVFTFLGMLQIRRSRLRAFEMFERSLFVSILLTQVFSFYKEQFSALLALLVNALILIAVRFVLEQERLAILAQGLSGDSD